MNIIIDGDFRLDDVIIIVIIVIINNNKVCNVRLRIASLTNHIFTILCDDCGKKKVIDICKYNFPATVRQ